MLWPHHKKSNAQIHTSLVYNPAPQESHAALWSFIAFVVIFASAVNISSDDLMLSLLSVEKVK